MKATLKSLRQTKADPAVSIFVKTHREHPDNSTDPIALKNQLKLAEERLTQEYDKRTAAAVLEQIHKKTDDLNHNYNLDTLAIFASTDDATVVRMPLDTTERIVISNRFATRDLVRDMASTVHYYTVVLTREKARLIEAANDRVVQEFDEHSKLQTTMENIKFPIDNNGLYTTGDAGSDRSTNKEYSYLQEFFNQVDKSVQEIWGEQKLPLVIVGDSKNIGYYKEACDRPDNIIATVSNPTELENGNAQRIIDSVQEAIEDYRTSLHKAAMGEIDKARGAGMLLTDLQEIYRAAYQGAGETLYVRRGYMQAAQVDEDKLTLTTVDEGNPADKSISDDVVGDIIEQVTQNGGKTVFMPQELMALDQPIALITRY